MSLAPSSPRLPSPPPPAEIQIGPKSPSMSTTAGRQASQMEQERIDANSKRRVRPGTKAADMAAGPPLIPLNELDSPFQLQEHLAALHYYHSGSNTQPITRTTAVQLATPPPSIDRTLWLYELCRFLISKCNSLIVGFLFDTPPCSATTCPEMRASEWQFLCAVHEQPKSCCAIDYCCHTLDWAANVVTDPKIFPSRIVVLSDSHNKGVAVKNLVNVFRRLHRIFAHAWFQHRGVFWNVEGQTGLYVFFKTVCDMYDLLPAENYKLPPEAEGIETIPAGVPEAGAASAADEKKHLQVPGPNAAKTAPSDGAAGVGAAEDEGHQQPAGRTSTRRHIRSSPSTGSAVTTVLESDEEDPTDVANRMKDMHISAPETVEEESEVAEVPVIVGQDVMEGASQAADKGDEVPGTTNAPSESTTETAPGGDKSADEDPPAYDPDATFSLDGEPEPPKEDAEAAKEVEPGDDVDMPDATEDSKESAPAGKASLPELSSTSIHDWADSSAKSDDSPKDAVMTPQESEDEREKDKETEAEPDPDAVPESEAKQETEPDTQPDVKPEPQTDSMPEAKSEAKSESKAETNS